MNSKNTPSQYAVYYMNVAAPIEYTGYFDSLAAVRKYLRERYAGNGFGLRFRAVYPQLEQKFHNV